MSGWRRDGAAAVTGRLAEAGALLASGDRAGAIASAVSALAGAPARKADVAAALRIVAQLRREGALADAAGLADALVLAAPREPMPLVARSQIRHVRGDLDGAIADTRAAMECAANPDDARARLAELLYEAGALEAAALEADAVIAARPGDVAALARRADIADAAGDAAGAGSLLDRALEIRRRTRIGSPALLMALLRAGRIEDALPDLDLRWQTAGAPPRPFIGASWDGRPLPDQTLLVWGEQGLGEEIWAAALLPAAARRVGRVVVECAPRLARLLRRSFPAITVVPRGDPPTVPPGHSVAAQVASVALVRALGPAAVRDLPHPPHLRADPAQVATLRARYRALGAGPLVGLSWRSANRHAALAKSASLAEWRPILGRRAVFVDLQYGDTAADRDRAAASGIAIHRDPSVDPLGDLDPVAAQVAAMDMVVTVSNTTAHLAGGLGVSSVVLLPRGRGQVWSWLDGTRPWYSRMRICRQPRAGDWTAAVAAAAAHLDGTLR
ncbi:MAG: hypothetical protein AB7O45_01020 [Alphaproteobacteria bacterium]